MSTTTPSYLPQASGLPYTHLQQVKEFAPGVVVHRAQPLATAQQLSAVQWKPLQAAKPKPQWGAAIKTALPRMVDALTMFAVSNLLPGVGHVFMMPIAVADGAVAVNEFRKAAGFKPLGNSTATAQFFEATKAVLNKAKVEGKQWEKPVKGAFGLGLASIAAGIIIHPLLLVGLVLTALPIVAKDLGIFVSVFKQLLAKGMGGR
jgi:hypothetical protein